MYFIYPQRRHAQQDGQVIWGTNVQVPMEKLF